MPTVLVVARPSLSRAAWVRGLTAGGFEVVQTESLLQALAVLDDTAVAAMLYEPPSVDEQRVLGAVSNLCDLPPIVVITEALAPLASRLPALRRLTPRTPSGRVVACVAAFAARPPVPPSRLPFRVCPAVEAQWTVRGRAEVGATIGPDADGFDGKTQPEGYALTDV
ncbi:MAG: hypothetical protein IPL61_39650 [Myxococcales bacterium]|nr:hypothetical protein [Myxococcales bacterium]